MLGESPQVLGGNGRILGYPRFSGTPGTRGSGPTSAKSSRMPSGLHWCPQMCGQDFNPCLQLRDRRWRGGPLKRWMTRVASCGRCGAPLVAGQVSRRRGPTYTCTTDRGCGRLAIKGKWLEQYVAGLIRDALSEESARSRFIAQDVDADELQDIESELETIRQKLDEADRDYEADILDRARWLARGERLAGKLKEVEVRRDRRLRAATAVNLPTGEVTPWWEALEPEMKRTVARLLFSKVVVTPAQEAGWTTGLGTHQSPVGRVEDSAVYRVEIAASTGISQRVTFGL